MKNLVHLVLRIDVISDLVDDVYDDLRATYLDIACLGDSFDCLCDFSDDKLCFVCTKMPCFLRNCNSDLDCHADSILNPLEFDSV